MLRLRTPVCLRRLEDPPPDPCVLAPTYYYSFVEFVFNVKCIFIPLKNEPNYYRICSNLASSVLLHLFFILNSEVFVDGGGGAKMFLAPGRRVP